MGTRSLVERRWLVGCMLVALALRLGYVLTTRHHGLVGDEVEYDIEGRLFASGHLFWSTTPYGIAHAAIWKAPGYPAFVGVLYGLLGVGRYDRVLVIQCLIGPLNVALTWALGRRLLGSGPGLAAAAVVAVYPFAWQYETRLYSESLATPLLLALLLVVLERPAGRRRALLAGLLLGVSLLVRPTAVILLPLIAVAWALTSGWRAGLGRAALAAGIAVLVVAPWTIRNAVVSGAFVPISGQDVAVYGVFNDQAAHDPVSPWAWRFDPSTLGALFDPAHPLPDRVVRARLIGLARDYIVEHPSSVLKAFFWNGLSRQWDVRRPARALSEVRPEGRTRAVGAVGLAMYWCLVALAIVGLARRRLRRTVWLPLLVCALAASIVNTAGSGTRYRAPLEPVIVVLGCAGAAGLIDRRRGAADRAGGLAVNRVAA